MNSNQTQPTGGPPRHRKRKIAIWAGAGFFGLALIGSVASHPSTQPTAHEGALASSSASSPSHVSAAVRLPSTTSQTSTSSTPPPPPAPALSMTCPPGGTVASPVFAHQVVATAPYTVAIQYGDGDQYSNDDQHLNAVFTHTYHSAGTFTVTAVVTDATQQTGSATCAYSWAPAATSHRVPAPAGGDTSSGDTYTNVDGNQLPGPVSADAPPAGATARCKDGTWSFSQHRQGTCSYHGGVAQWL